MRKSHTKGNREIEVAINERGEGTSRINLVTGCTSLEQHVSNTSMSELGTGACCYSILKIKIAWGSAVLCLKIL